MENEFKRTQGKWCKENRNGNYYIRKENSFYHAEFIGQMFYLGSPDEPHSEEGEANAQLISKAPEMLEMLIYLYNTLGTSFEKEKKEIENLIKEATTI